MYIREEAVEIAETIECRSSTRITINYMKEKISIILSVIKPNEEPIFIQINYDTLKVKVPIYAKEVEVIRGSSPIKKFEEFRRVSVYHNGSWIIVDPKPIVKYKVVSEYDRKCHLIEVPIFRIEGKLEVGSVLSYAYSRNVNYLRVYDYPGIAEIKFDDQLALQVEVQPKEIFRLIIIFEVWRTYTSS